MNYIAPYKIIKTEVISVTTDAQDIAVNGRSFIIQNNAANTVFVYFKEKDEVAATTTNGFRIVGGDTLPVVLTAGTLSIVGSASASVVIQYVD